MSEKLNIDQMCNAYRLLYEMETKLRMIIDDTLQKEYGLYWYLRSSVLPNINFLIANYFQLIHIIRKFPSLKSHFTETQIKELTQLNEVRNNICHMKDLTLEEYEHLVYCHGLVSILSGASIKRRKPKAKGKC
jgi:hypothetical protein